MVKEWSSCVIISELSTKLVPEGLTENKHFCEIDPLNFDRRNRRPECQTHERRRDVVKTSARAPGMLKKIPRKKTETSIGTIFRILMTKMLFSIT